MDLDALARNHRAIARALPAGCTPMPVVKADAYGHGAGPVSMRLQKEGASIFAVAVVEEGIELRQAGVTVPILVMGWIGTDQIADLVRHRLIANAHSLEQLKELVSFFEGKSVTLPIHLKLDTGMTRLGLRPEDLPEAIGMLKRAGGRLAVEGVFQNYASSDEAGAEQTREQTGVFFEGMKILAAAGIRPKCVHVANSGAVLLPPSFSASSGGAPGFPLPFEEIPGGSPGLSPTHVRPGLILYARLPGLDSPLNRQISDVMSFVSVVDQVKTVPAGTRVGYGGTFVAPRTTTLAIVPAGYADGVPRSLSGKGRVLLDGERCSIVGRISMDLLAVDVTDLPSPPRRGDEVVFFGTSRGVRLGVEEVAQTAGTVSWELLCGVGPRVPRVIVENGVAASIQSKFLVGKS